MPIEVTEVSLRYCKTIDISNFGIGDGDISIRYCGEHAGVRVDRISLDTNVATEARGLVGGDRPEECSRGINHGPIAWSLSGDLCDRAAVRIKRVHAAVVIHEFASARDGHVIRPRNSNGSARSHCSACTCIEGRACERG